MRMCQQPARLLADVQQTASRPNTSATAQHTERKYVCVSSPLRLWVLATAHSSACQEAGWQRAHVRCKGTVFV